MSEPLSVEHFDATMNALQGTLTAIDGRLETIEHRLDRIDEILWQGQKVDQLEQRFRELAERAGFPDLAQPLRRPL